ncbi:Fer3HCH family protein [Megaselia abdita]
MSFLRIRPLFSKRLLSSMVKQNFPEVCENGINRQINMELCASYVYLAMSYHFNREDVALNGLHTFFKKASHEEAQHAEKFMQYLNKRGGRILLEPIKKPTENSWTPECALIAALEMEKEVNKSLLEMHGVACKENDSNFCDFLEAEFLQEQVDGIKELADLLTSLKRCGDGLGVYIFDKNLENTDMHKK